MTTIRAPRLSPPPAEQLLPTVTVGGTAAVVAKLTEITDNQALLGDPKEYAAKATKLRQQNDGNLPNADGPVVISKCSTPIRMG